MAFLDPCDFRCRYYLSPELCADMPYRDKSDCWAFGVLLYEVRQRLYRISLEVLTTLRSAARCSTRSRRATSVR